MLKSVMDNMPISINICIDILIDSDSMFKLKRNGETTTMIKQGERKLMKQGSSTVVAIPPQILKNAGVKEKDEIAIYTNGQGQILIDLKPEDE